MAIEERECRANCLFFFRLLSLSLSLFLGQSAFRECPQAKEYDSHALVIDVQSANQSFYRIDVTKFRLDFPEQSQSALHRNMLSARRSSFRDFPITRRTISRWWQRYASSIASSAKHTSSCLHHASSSPLIYITIGQTVEQTPEKYPDHPCDVFCWQRVNVVRWFR